MRRLLQSNSGNVLVEFALSWAMLSIMFTGIFEYGYTMWTYNSLQSAVSMAAEAATRLTYDSSSSSTFDNQVKNWVVYGKPTAGTNPIVPGLTTANISVTRDSNSFPTVVTVSIQSFTVNSIFGSRTFNKPRVTMKYMGKITCSSC